MARTITTKPTRYIIPLMCVPSVDADALSTCFELLWLRPSQANLVSAARLDLGPESSRIRDMIAELTSASDLSRTRHVWSIIAVPVTLAVLGVVLRYLGYLSVAGRASPQGFVDSMCVWDCYWYGDIAAKGYQAYPEQLNFGGPAGIANWAFFPLYPLLIAGMQRLTGATPAMLGAIVSPVLSLGAALASLPLFAGDRRAYFLFAAFLLAGPFCFYFAVLYSESLFLLLTVLALVELQRRSFIAAGATAPRSPRSGWR